LFDGIEKEVVYSSISFAAEEEGYWRE